MKTLHYCLFIAVATILYSCTALKLVKGDATNEVSKKIAKNIAKEYKVTGPDSSLSRLNLADRNGKRKTFEQLFSGKILYVGLIQDLKQLDQYNSSLLDLKKRFQDNPKVMFINLYVGKTQAISFPDSLIQGFRLIKDEQSKFLFSRNTKMVDYLIVNKNGMISCNNAPKPTDRILVDYLIHQASLGHLGYPSTIDIINEVGDKKYNNANFSNWYNKHFHEPFNGKLSFTISEPRSGNPTVSF